MSGQASARAKRAQITTPLKLSLRSRRFVGVGESVSRMNSEEVLFKSSERQKIIDFIIRSRIRDSGAELDERNGLGKNIEVSSRIFCQI